MRVLQVVTKRQYRGAEVFASILASDLAARGHEMLFLGLYSPPAGPLAAPGATNLDLDVTPGRPLQAVVRMYRFLRKYRPEVVQCNGSDTLKYTWLASLFIPDSPPIVYRNISMMSHWIKGAWKRGVYKVIFSGVSVVVSVSDASRQDFIKLIRKKSSGVLTIKNVITIKRGIDLPSLNHRDHARHLIEKDRPFLIDRPLLLHVGAMTPEKNHQGLLRILALIVTVAPKVCLICLGEGPERSNLEQLAVEMNLTDHVCFAGHVADPGPFYAAADLLLLPSHIEGIPGVVLEAAAFQTPAVAYNVGGMAEAIIQQVTGVLVDEDRERTFAGEVVRLLADAPGRASMGLAARNFVESNYSREATVRSFENLYQRVLATKQLR